MIEFLLFIALVIAVMVFSLSLDERDRRDSKRRNRR